MHGPILVVNAGSSSIKFAVFEARPLGALALRLHGDVDGIGASPRLRIADRAGVRADEPIAGSSHEAAIEAIQQWFACHGGDERRFAAVGHRIVHGGDVHTEPVRIDDAVVAALEALVPLAPLHQPHQVAAIRAVAAIAPRVPQVACFDTAFHRDQPPLARAFALPRAITQEGVRRYGFHGLSYEYIVSALPRVAPECVGRRLIVAHLGNGASLCAIERGRSVATTMGLTALDGLPMGTRCGALDPGVVLYLLMQRGIAASQLEALLYEQSGLLGVSGISSDMRTLLASDEVAAREAIDLFVYRIVRELGSLAAALGGVDAIVFTGGIGENAAPIRARVLDGARWLGAARDEAANARHGPRISAPDARVSAWVIPTDENVMVARHTRRLLEANDAA
ncbi:MAG TPA: acetate/propionate family kinase [Casimicrobiaceae bacterium]|nr:acetate/propionate family kinase [Casimicrobiaceae bacterium]